MKKNGNASKDNSITISKTNSEISHSSNGTTPDQHYLQKSQSLPHLQAAEYQKNLETAKHAINRFIKNVDKEIQLI